MDPLQAAAKRVVKDTTEAKQDDDGLLHRVARWLKAKSGSDENAEAAKAVDEYVADDLPGGKTVKAAVRTRNDRMKAVDAILEDQ